MKDDEYPKKAVKIIVAALEEFARVPFAVDDDRRKNQATSILYRLSEAGFTLKAENES